MKHLLKTISAMVFVSSAHAELSATAGMTLLESFRCESTNGSAVQGVRTSLSSLKSTLEKIAEQQKECQADLAGVGKLPEIDSILRQIDNHGLTEEVKRQENIITEALHDLALIKLMPMDHPDRALYPDEATLQSMIATARVELVKVRADYTIQAGKANRQKYLDGVRQLDTLAQELSASLRKNSPCFQKNPVMRRQVLSGLVGIAGFFAQTPAGIGITLAGRVLQNIFDISDSNAANNNQNFESSHQALLSAGLACTMENLSAQHCKLIRQDGLLQQLKEKPCEKRECSTEMKQLLKVIESGKSATDAVQEVTSWLGSKTDNTADQATAMKINADFLALTSTFESGIISALDKAKQSEGSSLSEVQKDNQYNAIKDLGKVYAVSLYGKKTVYVNDCDACDDQVAAKKLRELNSMFSNREKEYQGLNLIYDDKELDNLVSETMQKIGSSTQLKQKYGVEGSGGLAGSTTLEEAARKVLTDAFAGVVDSGVPQAQSVKDRMKNRVAFDRIKARMAQYKSQILQKTTVKPADEQLGNFMMAFLQEDLGKPSTLRNFENISAFFDSIPEDFLKSRDSILKISALKSEVAEITQLGSGLDNGSIEMSTENVNKLSSKVSKLLDPSRGFKERLTNIATSVGSFQTQRLTRFAKQPQDVNDLVFLQNRDFIESVYDMRNPYQKEVDTKTAIALSASQIDSFGRFFESYMDPALQMLNKSDIRGNRFSDGLSENIDRNLKDHFCIQALGLTSIPSRISKECRDARLSNGGDSLEFEKLEKTSHKERVCAYRNFINRADIAKNKRYQKQPASGSGSKMEDATK